MGEQGLSGAMEFPFVFRVGAVGAGIGVGCGLGIGLGKPLNLGERRARCSPSCHLPPPTSPPATSPPPHLPLAAGGIPGVTQVVYGITSGLGQLAPMGLGNLGHGGRQALQRLAPGLDAGMGCGVGVGYGFGVGLMLKPSAAQQLQRAVVSAAGWWQRPGPGCSKRGNCGARGAAASCWMPRRRHSGGLVLGPSHRRPLLRCAAQAGPWATLPANFKRRGS
jgi:hypothetical protein